MNAPPAENSSIRSLPPRRRRRRPSYRWRRLWSRRAPGAAALAPGPAGAGAGLKLAHAVDYAPAVGLDERAGGGELFDPVVGVGDVDVARAIGGDASGVVELPGAAARDPGLAGAGAGLKLASAVDNAPAVGLDERAGGGELVDPVVALVGDVDVTRAIGGDAVRVGELPGAVAIIPSWQVLVQVSTGSPRR